MHNKSVFKVISSKNKLIISFESNLLQVKNIYPTTGFARFNKVHVLKIVNLFVREIFDGKTADLLADMRRETPTPPLIIGKPVFFIDSVSHGDGFTVAMQTSFFKKRFVGKQSYATKQAAQNAITRIKYAVNEARILYRV